VNDSLGDASLRLTRGVFVSVSHRSGVFLFCKSNAPREAAENDDSVMPVDALGRGGLLRHLWTTAFAVRGADEQSGVLLSG
jgi:hypothetical protein